MRARRRPGRSRPGATEPVAGAVGRRRCPLLLVGQLRWDPAWSPTAPLLVDVPTSTLASAATLAARLAERRTSSLDPGECRPRSSCCARAGRAGGGGGAAAGAARRRRRVTVRAPARRRPRRERRRPRTARPPDRARGRLGRPGAAAGDPDGAAGGRRAGPAPRAGARRLADAPRRRPRAAASPRCSPGDSGTGKTMSAEVIAGELGLDLYVVDLATVVDKYVGETEKNLERIFAAAAGVNGVLLFDEADAVFGKRVGGQRRPRPLRQHRERLPAAAHGDLRRAGDPGHQPARQHRRGLHPPARRASSTSRCPTRGQRLRAVGPLPRAAAAAVATTSTSSSARDAFELRAAASARPPSPRRTSPPRDGWPVTMAQVVIGRAAGVPQARPARAWRGVRPLLRVARAEVAPPTARGQPWLPDGDARSAGPPDGRRGWWTTTVATGGVTMHAHDTIDAEDADRCGRGRAGEKRHRRDAAAGRGRGPHRRPRRRRAAAACSARLGNGAVSAWLRGGASPVHDVVTRRRYAARRTDVRADMEARLGHDFGDVRVHTDGAAARLGPVGERARLHGRLQHRLPARQLRPGPRPARCSRTS